MVINSRPRSRASLASTQQLGPMCFFWKTGLVCVKNTGYLRRKKISRIYTHSENRPYEAVKEVFKSHVMLLFPSYLEDNNECGAASVSFLLEFNTALPQQPRLRCSLFDVRMRHKQVHVMSD